MKKQFSLKDHLFNRDSVTYLADLFSTADATFKQNMFIDEVMTKLLKLELKERIIWIAEVLENYLPKDFAKASTLIIKALPVPLDPTKTDDDFGSFIFAPLGEYVVRNGLSEKRVATSLRTIFELTQRFSMEDAIRYFIDAYPEKTLSALQKWSLHDNYHVRRLVSEGTRPLLPWSRRITLDYATTIPLLDLLHTDTTRYVTRSVANHLNDISKRDPSLVVSTLTRWSQDKTQNAKELAWIIKHALRTLVKQGNTEALLLLGYTKNPKILVETFERMHTSRNIKPGEVLSFSCSITALENTALLVDYVIDFVKANGRTKPKVFKIKNVELTKGEKISIVKRHRLVADATTYTLHRGIHTVSLQVNGVKLNSFDFIVSST